MARGGEDELIKIHEKFKGTLRASTPARMIPQGHRHRREEKTRRSRSEAGAWEETEERGAEKGFSLMSLSAPQVILQSPSLGAGSPGTFLST